MTQMLKRIEWNGVTGDPMYFRFSDSIVAATESHAAGEVNVDLDANGAVVGVELLSGDAADFTAFFEIAEARGLDLAGVHLSPALMEPGVA
ncbi:MAG: DUF2283 domain-containing protein [Candidatus Eremiobacteraeota bacterium]|nr:DUF2283 domain-containing protein [Candidatus Eremiobacteraeota bacterium]